MNPSMLYAISLFLGAAGAWIVANNGGRMGLIDKPNERSSHRQPVPKGGGMGIFLVFLVASIVLYLPTVLWISGCMVAMISLIGDRVEISPKIRLCLQFLGSLLFLSGAAFSPFDSMGNCCLLFLLSTFMVGTANFYNFMDGINGIAGIAGFIGFALLGFAAYDANLSSAYVRFSICMSLACLGFLTFNIPSAKVFMGDVGSVLLGFVFAGMVVLMTRNVVDFLCMSAFLFPFYADELITMFVRIKNAENLLKPHRRHIYQLLANEGKIEHWKISVGYGLFQFAAGMSIWTNRDLFPLGLFGISGIWFVGFAIFGWWVRSRLENGN